MEGPKCRLQIGSQRKEKKFKRYVFFVKTCFHILLVIQLHSVHIFHTLNLLYYFVILLKSRSKFLFNQDKTRGAPGSKKMHKYYGYPPRVSFQALIKNIMFVQSVLFVQNRITTLPIGKTSSDVETMFLIVTILRFPGRPFSSMKKT